MLLYAVTDRAWLHGRTLPALVEDAVRGGATFVQLREKDMEFAAFLDEARRVKAVTDRYHVPFVINDDVEVARACNADGVHVGQDDATVSEARRVLGPDKIIGVSVHTVDEAPPSRPARIMPVWARSFPPRPSSTLELSHSRRYATSARLSPFQLSPSAASMRKICYN